MPSWIYAHLTWTTRNREECIDARCAEFLAKFLPPAARRYEARVLEVGIVANHVHLVLMLGDRIDLPRLVQGLKGASARIANRDGVTGPKNKLRWASGYDLRSISPRELHRVQEYVRNQVKRHPELAPKESGAA